MTDQQNDLEIHYAKYGSDAQKRDVIDYIDEQISSNDRLNLLVNNDNLGGDHYSGKPKQLHIIYTFNGVLYEEKLDEGEMLIIPEIGAKTTENRSAAWHYLISKLLDSASGVLITAILLWGISRIVRAWRFDTYG